MHPVLFDIPLPHWRIALGPVLVLVAVIGVVIAALGIRSRSWDLVGIGSLGAIASLWASRTLQGQWILLEPMPLYGFGIFLSAGLLGGWFLTLRLAEREGLPREVIAGCYFAAALSGLLGARLLYVLTNLGDFHSIADVAAFRNGGLVFYGGVLGGLVGSLLYLRPRRVPWFAWADVAAPSIAFGAALGRLGCYLAGCDYGLPLPEGAPAWLVRLGTFPRWPDEVAGAAAGAPAWIDQVLYRGLPFDSTASRPVHPTQLYESLGAALLLGVLLVLRSRRAFRGQIFLTFVAGYGALRFLLETVRDDPERGHYGPSAPPRVLVALGLFVLAVAFVAGPSRSLANPRQRIVARTAALLLPFGAYWVASGRSSNPTPLSTSQWIAVLSSAAVAAAWRLLDDSAAPRRAVP